MIAFGEQHPDHQELTRYRAEREGTIARRHDQPGENNPYDNVLKTAWENGWRNEDERLRNDRDLKHLSGQLYLLRAYVLDLLHASAEHERIVRCASQGCPEYATMRNPNDARVCNEHAHHNATVLPYTRALAGAMKVLNTSAVKPISDRGHLAMGLHHKYRVEKADGTATDPRAEYFVLRLDTDRFARAAARAYANAIRGTNPHLAADIAAVLQRFDEVDFA